MATAHSAVQAPLRRMALGTLQAASLVLKAPECHLCVGDCVKAVAR